ncbi:Site-specific recombinase XerD [Roseibium album]|nr:Site-specific recombinase XerD [Roseibium album]
MPRKTKGPRLWLRPSRKDRPESAVWIIRDGTVFNSTGCGEAQLAEAEKLLRDYIAEKHDPTAEGKRGPNLIPIADAINLYSTDVAPNHTRPDETAHRLERLLAYFGDKPMSFVKGSTCRKYTESRKAPGAARRELEDLRSAFNHAFKEGIVDRQVPITLPDKPAGRERWLERDEAARLLWAAWRLRQKYKGQPTKRATAKHVARFILVALYTGSRAGAVCGAAIRPTLHSAYVDLEAGLFYRKPPGAKQTKKRAPPVALPDRLLAHLRRWERKGISKNYVVEWHGKPVTKINKSFRTVREAAGFDNDVIPHTLRHTAATWLARNGVPMSDAADYVGMSVETFDRVYRHHAPDFQERARNMITAKPTHSSKATETKPKQSDGGAHSPQKRHRNELKPTQIDM